MLPSLLSLCLSLCVTLVSALFKTTQFSCTALESSTGQADLLPVRVFVDLLHRVEHSIYLRLVPLKELQQLFPTVTLC